ncbi:hypothetical protein BY458DRAFT_293033 [Sporodiniella umbellata]|nr:hypothetical protein BY458DRAFT_293033 [Sporodiniella umbellata]
MGLEEGCFLAEFEQVFGSMEGSGSNRKSSQPLCDNIFDVQRNELFEVLDSLRLAFWNPGTMPSGQVRLGEVESVKEEMVDEERAVNRALSGDNEMVDEERAVNRALSGDNEMVDEERAVKRRLSIATEEPPLKKSKGSPIKTMDLWHHKVSLLRLLQAKGCDEERVLQRLWAIQDQITLSDQRIHFINYFKPVAEKTRRQNVLDGLNKMGLGNCYYYYYYYCDDDDHFFVGF